MVSENFALLPVYKPEGYTSTDILNFIKERFKVEKIGHTGTLDPFAEGLLIFLLGKATRLTEEYQKLPKRYVAVGLWGIDTDTYDITGKVLQEIKKPPPTAAELENALKNFIGEIEQIPPPFSAKKIRGRRAYKLARKGKKVELKPVKVKVYELKLLEYNPPRFTLEAEVSGGTYIRSLIRDIAISLGGIATTEKLKRVSIGSITLEDAVSLEELERAESLKPFLRSPDEGLKHLRVVKLSERELERFKNGQILPFGVEKVGETVRVYDKRGNFVALGRLTERGLKPEKVFIS